MGKQLLTNSRGLSFKKCRKKHYYEYELGLRKEVDAKALRMGSAGHEALDVLNKTGDSAKAVEAVGDYYGLMPDGFDPYDWAIEIETMECLIVGYCWRWNPDHLPDAGKIEVDESEQSFRLPLKNPETGKPTPLWDAAGKIDGIINVNSSTMVFEHKFISDDISENSDYWLRLNMDPQISLYTWAAREMGYDVSGVYYDLIRKPTIRPSQVPYLDEDGKKIVLDEKGNRVFNTLKPKKSCDYCEGTGIGHTHPDPTLDAPYSCECTRGKPRQTGDKEKGYELQSRNMTPDEWGEKLLDDIYARPEFYFCRKEIPRLDVDIDECMSEMWDLQKTIRETQKNGRWYKTVDRDNCSFCPFFAQCVSRVDCTKVTPEGFVRLDDPHPELK